MKLLKIGQNSIFQRVTLEFNITSGICQTLVLLFNCKVKVYLQLKLSVCDFMKECINTNQESMRTVPLWANSPWYHKQTKKKENI